VADDLGSERVKEKGNKWGSSVGMVTCVCMGRDT
jgi:hypothetical protein